MVIKVVKNDGSVDYFDKSKIMQSCMRAGATYELAEKIASEVENEIYDGITTKEIMKKVKEKLRKYKVEKVYIKYPLKDALALLDPEFHEFEHFVAKLFTYLGYDAQRSPYPHPEGFCVDHEIDVLLRNNKGYGIVECKHHYKQKKLTNLGVVMRQWARLMDFREAHRRHNSIDVKEAWVVTNTKFTYHAIKYSKCKRVYLLGWNYPPNKGINHLIEKYKAYPLTLFNIKPSIRKELLEKENVIDANDLLRLSDDKLKHYFRDNYKKIKKKIITIIAAQEGDNDHQKNN
ncbi:MAG: hypothetical protein GXN99_02080 [Candidatus Nanohaloarchaeota archaeon]|nr:hypothetical protein [Candidatus Nanohaloarchaeota archaeon]